MMKFFLYVLLAVGLGSESGWGTNLKIFNALEKKDSNTRNFKAVQNILDHYSRSS